MFVAFDDEMVWPANVISGSEDSDGTRLNIVAEIREMRKTSIW